MDAGSVQTGGAVQAGQKPVNEKLSSNIGAENPGRVNRSSITEHSSPALLRASQLYPTLEGKDLGDFKVAALPADDVKLHMTPPPPTPPELSKAEEIKFGRASRLIGRINTELQKGSYEPQVRSEGAFKVRVSQAKDSKDIAASLLRQAVGLDRDATLSVNLRDSGLGGSRLSVAGTQAETAILAAQDLLNQRKEELEQAKAELSSLQKQFKREAKANRKAEEARHKLDNKANVLKTDVDSIRGGIEKASDSSSKAIGQELDSVKAALSKAKSAQSSANKLLGNLQKESGRHGINVEALKAKVQGFRANAGDEIAQLKKEITALKEKKSAAQRQEKKAKQAEKAEQKQFDQAIRKSRQADRDFEKPAKQTTSTKPQSEPASPSQPRKQSVSPSPSPSPKVVRKESRRSSESELRPLNPDNADVKLYVAKVKPSSKLKFGDIEKSITSARLNADYKQALADIQAARLETSDKQKLRGYLSAAVLNAMKDPAKFQHLTPELIEHAMFGLSHDQILAEYPEAVARNKEYLSKVSRRLSRG